MREKSDTDSVHLIVHDHKDLSTERILQRRSCKLLSEEYSWSYGLISLWCCIKKSIYTASLQLYL